MTARTLRIVLTYLSAVWLPFVSAGGAYCAKTARARAAALGLKFPGVHGAPDLSGPPAYSALHPRGPHHQLLQNNPQPPDADFNTLYNPPQEFPHFKAAGFGRPVQTHPLSGLSGDEPSNNRWSGFVQVKRVIDPRMQTRPSGQIHKSKPNFAYNGRYPSVDAAVPNRHGMSGFRGRHLPLSSGQGFYYMQHPSRVGSKPGAVHPAMGAWGSQLRGHSDWSAIGRANNEPKEQFYFWGES